MNDEDLLGAVVDLARAERRRAKYEDRLAALTLGELPEAEREALDAELAKDPELDAARVVFRPIGDAAKAGTTERILRDIAGSRAAAGSAKKGLRRQLGFGRVAAAVALAAGVLLGVGALRAPRALPSYELTVSGEQPMRGEPPAVKPDARPIFHFSRREPFRVLLRPARAFDGRVTARVFLVRGDDVRAWATPVDVSSEGAIRIVTSVDTLPPGSAGEWDMAIVVARPDAMPTELSVSAIYGAPNVLRARVRFDLD